MSTANTDDREWMIRYFAAMTYIDLAGLTNDTLDKQQYLENAVFFLRRNLSYLSDENEKQLEKYKGPLDTSPSGKRLKGALKYL